MKTVTFPYQKLTSLMLMPMLPIRLERLERGFDTVALVDSGASISVLPHSIGLALGCNWDEAKKGVSLGGSYSSDDTRVIALNVFVPEFQKKAISFLWLPNDNARLLLGQAHFFQYFDVCFSGNKQEFYIREPQVNT